MYKDNKRELDLQIWAHLGVIHDEIQPKRATSVIYGRPIVSKRIAIAGTPAMVAAYRPADKS